MRLADAQKSLDEAQRLAQQPDHVAKYERLQRMAAYLIAFREAVAASLENLGAGATLSVGTSTQVGVVEAQPDHITVRVAGANRRYAVDEMPIGLAVAVANHSMPENTESKVIKGAYVLINAQSTEDFREKARTWWQEAEQSGELGDMMLFLDDTYDFAPAGGAK